MKLKISVTFLSALLIPSLAGCDLRSETAKREMEKFTSSPTPTISPTPPPPPIDPADVVKVDASLDGPMIQVNGTGQTRSVICSKFNRVMVNGDDNNVTIKGVCRQVMVNGDRHQVTADAAAEFVINGESNIVRYSRYVNGKHPIVRDNARGNTIEKAAASASR